MSGRLERFASAPKSDYAALERERADRMEQRALKYQAALNEILSMRTDHLRSNQMQAALHSMKNIARDAILKVNAPDAPATEFADCLIGKGMGVRNGR